jgi:siroheme synthase-like protein
MPRYIPMMVDVEDKNVLVICGGHIAYRKTKLLLENGAKVIVIAKEFYKGFRNSTAKLIQNDIRDVDDLKMLISNSLVVIAATENRETNDYVEKLCNMAGKMCNIVDKPSTYVMFPAFFKKRDVIVSVSTSGNVPYFSAFLRDIAKNDLHLYLKGYTLLKQLRKKLMKVEPKARKSVLKEVVHDSKFWDCVKANDKKSANKIINEITRKLVNV